MTKQVRVPFSIKTYHDEVLCDVAPMSASHLLHDTSNGFRVLEQVDKESLLLSFKSMYASGSYDMLT